MSEANKGKKLSEETKRKISANNKRRAAQKRCRRMAASDPLMGDFED